MRRKTPPATTMKNTANIILALFALAGCFFIGRCSRQVVEKEVRTTDTIATVRIDTIVAIEPRIITEKRIDTVYTVITERDTIYLPAIQRYYAEDGVYDVWISGVNPKMDSIKTYPRTEIRTITNTIEKTVILKEWEFWLGGGIGVYRDEFFPMVELDVYTPKNWGASVGVGYFENAPFYKATLKIKL